MLECVPNFSEGRDKAIMEAIVAAIQSAPGVLLCGWEMDADHNRSVVTFAGDADAVIEGATRGVGRAAAVIRLPTHSGVHPRVGAADVVPFIPLDGSTMAEAVAAAHRTGEAIWKHLKSPAYFYGEAARRDSRKRLERVRKTGFDGHPQDVGNVATHPTAGASMVGARDFLVAYNVDLSTNDLSAAQEIAKRIRESSGGFKYVKAIGLYLESRGCAQVSMNLTNFAQTPLDEVLKAIGPLAAEGEIIGFIPKRAYHQAPEFFRFAANFSEDRILENRLAQLIP